MTNPKFYDASKVGTLFYPRTAEAIEAGSALGLPLSHRDTRKTLLLLVDPQVDFIHTQGTLCVPGAIDDTRRTIEWIYRNLGEISEIAISLDTHLPFQIFHPSWWVDKNGNHPDPFTAISIADYNNRVWRPIIRIEYEYELGKTMDWNRYYLTQLDQSDKKLLVAWPYHVMLGSPGHSLDPSLFEAVMYQSGARMSQPQFLTKGSIPQTENYSILEPEVKVPSHPLGGSNNQFLDMLDTYDLIYIAGQAKSHCVYETIKSIVRYFTDPNNSLVSPEVLNRIRILEDCTSSVPGFEEKANQDFVDLERVHGLKLVKSTDSIG